MQLQHVMTKTSGFGLLSTFFPFGRSLDGNKKLAFSPQLLSPLSPQTVWIVLSNAFFKNSPGWRKKWCTYIFCFLTWHDITLHAECTSSNLPFWNMNIFRHQYILNPQVFWACPKITVDLSTKRLIDSFADVWPLTVSEKQKKLTESLSEFCKRC